MPLNKPNRRIVIAGGVAAFLPLRAFGLTEPAATAFVERVIDDFFEVINLNQPEAQMLRSFEQVFTPYADVDIIARSVLGPPYRQLTTAQKSAFSNAFGHYLSNKYGRQFREYRGADITITRVQDAGSKGFLVSSQMRVSGQSPWSLDWQISDRSGRTKIINLIIEGISLLTSEREEIRALLEARRGNVTELTNYLASV